MPNPKKNLSSPAPPDRRLPPLPSLASKVSLPSPPKARSPVLTKILSLPLPKSTRLLPAKAELTPRTVSTLSSPAPVKIVSLMPSMPETTERLSLFAVPDLRLGASATAAATPKRESSARGFSSSKTTISLLSIAVGRPIENG